MSSSEKSLSIMIRSLRLLPDAKVWSNDGKVRVVSLKTFSPSGGVTSLDADASVVHPEEPQSSM